MSPLGLRFSLGQGLSPSLSWRLTRSENKYISPIKSEVSPSAQSSLRAKVVSFVRITALIRLEFLSNSGFPSGEDSRPEVSKAYSHTASFHLSTAAGHHYCFPVVAERTPTSERGGFQEVAPFQAAVPTPEPGLQHQGRGGGCPTFIYCLLQDSKIPDFHELPSFLGGTPAKDITANGASKAQLPEA